MADIKFSCSQCGQHIACDALWSGHQIQCPACQANLTVPQAQPALAAAATLAPASPVSQPITASRPKLSAGVTQVARPSSPGPTPQRRVLPRAPKRQNSLLGYAVLGLVLAGIGIAAYNYVPALLNQVQDSGNSKSSSSTTAPVSAGGGPLGEVNGAMDVSDALDGGSPSRARATAPRQPPANLATNSAARPVKR